MRLEFHHLGLACRDMAKEEARLAVLHYRAASPTYSDAGLGVKVRFLEGPGPRLELVEQLPGSVLLEPWLAQGHKIYHMAYFVSQLESAIDYFRAEGAKVLVKSTPAVAFDLAPISFLLLPNRLLVEFIEKPLPENTA